MSVRTQASSHLIVRVFKYAELHATISCRLTPSRDNLSVLQLPPSGPFQVNTRDGIIITLARALSLPTRSPFPACLPACLPCLPPSLTPSSLLPGPSFPASGVTPAPHVTECTRTRTHTPLAHHHHHHHPAAPTARASLFSHRTSSSYSKFGLSLCRSPQ
jgi:hypothetical protein